MRIQLLSDLHLECEPDFMPRAADDTDVLVLAGDIGSYQDGSLLTGDDFGLSRFSPLKPAAPWKRVLYIPGNHEFDSLDYASTYAKLRDTCHSLGIEWLESEIIKIGSVRFIGSTLWTDFESLARQEHTMTSQMRALEKAYRAANFYLEKHTTFHNGLPMLAEDIRALGQASQVWLENALAVPFDGTTIAVTHFAPTLRSADPRYGLTPGTAGFCNALDHLLPYAQYWLHGHLHCPNDYLTKGKLNGRAWSCRIIANPRGYADKAEQASFQNPFVLEIED
jgi:predicted phosphodiesterase